jgi:hypothetical protein
MLLDIPQPVMENRRKTLAAQAVINFPMSSPKTLP